MKSFPSGHAQLAVCCAVFFIVICCSVVISPHSSVFQTYLQKRRVTVVSSLVQVVLIVLALYCGYSRVLDRRHHLTDVMAGSVLGAVVGFLTSNSLNVQSLY